MEHHSMAAFSGTMQLIFIISFFFLLPHVTSSSHTNNTKEQPLRPPSPAPAPKAPRAPKAKTAHVPAPAAAPAPKTPRAPKAKTAPVPSSAPAAAPAPGKGKAKAPAAHRTVTNGTLDPSQAKALQLLGVTADPDACNTDVQQLMICDNHAPLRHLIFLQLQYCFYNATLSNKALQSLETLNSLSFLDCPMRVAPLPPKLAESLEKFSCTSSLGRTAENRDLPALPGGWLRTLRGLKELSIEDVVVNASGGGVGAVMGNMSGLQQVTFSNTNITGTLPKSWPLNLSSLQISHSMVKGSIPASISNLSQLESLDLSFNNLTGPIPGAIGSLKNLQMLSLSSNKLSGSIPKGFKNLTLLTYLDLSNNGLNGTVPAFIAAIKSLRYLDLRNNKFHGVLPFSTAFVKNLNTFKVGANPELCYNDSLLLPAISGGAEPCDSKGRPSKGGADSPANAPEEFGPSPAPSEEAERPRHKKKGPKTVVLAVSIALASLVFVIVVAVVLSRWCARKD